MFFWTPYAYLAGRFPISCTFLNSLIQHSCFQLLLSCQLITFQPFLWSWLPCDSCLFSFVSSLLSPLIWSLVFWQALSVLSINPATIFSSFCNISFRLSGIFSSSCGAWVYLLKFCHFIVVSGAVEAIKWNAKWKNWNISDIFFSLSSIKGQKQRRWPETFAPCMGTMPLEREQQENGFLILRRIILRLVTLHIQEDLRGLMKIV